jgi:hypothetical protein
MDKLIQYIADHTERGECQCGQCADKGPERPAPAHSVDVHFYWVSAKDNPTKEELLPLLKEYPDQERLAGGPSYVEMGGMLGSQDLALRLIGLGALVGVWEAITPERLGITGAAAQKAAGYGYVMCSGLRQANGKV